jgi:hypothetical protein
MAKISLEQQCKNISLELYEINLQYSGDPEPAALRYFESLGYIGAYVEGTTILITLKALMLDALSENNIFHDRNDACCRYLEAQLVILKDKIDLLVSSIAKTSRESFVRNATEILNQPFIKGHYPSLTLDCLLAIFDAIDTDVFQKLVMKISEDPYGYRAGWPDITIIKGKEVQFIEVKTTDALHSSQLKTIPVMMAVLPYKFSVYRLM